MWAAFHLASVAVGGGDLVLEGLQRTLYFGHHRILELTALVIEHGSEIEHVAYVKSPLEQAEGASAHRRARSRERARAAPHDVRATLVVARCLFPLFPLNPSEPSDSTGDTPPLAHAP